ncbi:Methyltransferase type II [Streptococcus agalactiae]|nr:class I SAM-dependent methyltransferase [Streptococcus agalactiae]CFR05921.1 Methyltransferase type II [Streptococcus agalactiae]CNE43998.1 Methyltransferase type II [Streptococcus agalactiae]CNE58692.1 Methyltransferase type II [Streptococcus agalactiae]CNI38275.1 Methyltransferase type II [Streptococcus agalactiae]CNJ24676.1 Methyltransferase type II [Streptococcus agalactiae]
MLTMLNNSAKEKAIKEYLRVLKPSGRLLTHDVSYQDEDTAKLIDQLRHTMNINVAPLKIDDWQNLFLQNGF